MKKLTVFILTTALAVMFASQAMAQDAGKQNADTKKAAQTQTFGKFVDNNKDGVCDNFQARGQEGRGARFVDANGDGVCDHRADGTCGKCGTGCCKGRQGNCGKGLGHQHRHGCGSPCGLQKAPDKK